MILYGLLGWWQISRATRAATTDRDNAVKDTSARVSAAVAKTVTEQYAGMIAEQKNQIDQLQSQLGNKFDVFSGRTMSSLSAMQKQINDDLALAKSISSTSTLKVTALELAKKIDDFVLGWTRVTDRDQNATDEEKEAVGSGTAGVGQSLQVQVNDVTNQLKALDLMDNKDNEGNSGNGCGFKPKTLADTILPRRVCAATIESAAEKIP